MVQLAEIAVTAEAERGTVNRALDEQRNATNIVSSVTAEQIRRSPDSDAGQAVQRVSGVTVQDGRYVFVRGLGERYTTTSLNGARVPSPEPERKVVPLDLFPASLLEGITTSKTFTPDQPGDFSGAAVNLKTREFPARRIITFSASGGLNTAATGKELARAPRVGREWLGFAGAARDLPGPLTGVSSLAGRTREEINGMIGSFRNAWSPRFGDGSANGGLGVTVGGEDPVFGQSIGYIGAFTYSNGQEVRSEESRALVQTTANGFQPINQSFGGTVRNSVLWGGILNLTTRLGQSTKVSFNNTYNRSADNEATELAGENEEFDVDLDVTRLTFIERTVRSHQVTGEHLLGDQHLVDWSLSASKVDRTEPDRSDVAYITQIDPTTRVSNPVAWFGGPRSATRTFSDLNEKSYEGQANYRLFLGSPDQPITIKVGGAFRAVDRDADSRSFDITNRSLSLADRGTLARADLRRALRPGRAPVALPQLVRWTVRRQGPAERRLCPGRDAHQPSAAAHRRRAGGALDAGPELAGSAGPAVHRLARQHRHPAGAVAQLRPDRQPDPPAVGQPDAVASRVPGDRHHQLVRADRWGDHLRQSRSPARADPELRPAVGVVSAGRTRRSAPALFAKRFNDPIERVFVAQTGALANSFLNAERADNYGIELEVRKSLDFVSPGLAALTLFANTTLMRSEITPGSNVLTSGDRPMVGQAEYVVNSGLTYAGPGGINATALYNVVGARVLEAGARPFPDTYELARHVVDVSVLVPVLASTSIRLDAKNLLDSPYRVEQGGVTRLRYKAGRVFAFGASWNP